jgi:hypothetical protein
MLRPLRSILFVTAFLSVSLSAACQTPPFTACPNSNFSQGTFENWTGCYGYFSDPCYTQGFDTTSTWPLHKIITDVTALDPNTCNNMLKICPGETHSARLGHEGGSIQGAGAQLKFNIQVNTQPYYFCFKYALVLDNGGHVPEQQPNFRIEITDSTGNYVDPVYGNQYFYAGFNQPGYQICAIGPGIYWKDWNTDSIDLSAFAGQTITATFTARDCMYGAHHGYGYIVTYCITPVTRQWTGLLSSEWNNPANWSPPGVPSEIDLALIPQSAATMPVVNATGMHCHDLMLENGATITIPDGFTLIVNGDVYLNLPK